MDPVKLIREKAKRQLKKIVLPESGDERIIEAAVRITEEKIASIVILGNIKDTKKRLQKFSDYNYKEDAIEIVDPETSGMLDTLAEQFYERKRRKHPNKNFSRKILLSNYVFIAAMMLSADMADGFVAGAKHTTRDVAKAAIHCVTVDEAIGVASGAFVMHVKDSNYGDNGLFLFADCALTPDPNPMQLAGIAVSSARLYKQLFNRKPYTAMLSYSTKNSARGHFIDKVKQAVEEAKKLDTELVIDGELQVDSALDPLVARIKTSIKGSQVAGRANVLIFPNLDSGNIGYKLVQRLAGARAIGPLIQGLKKPCSDLSRGCSVEDVIDAVAITAVRAQK